METNLAAFIILLAMIFCVTVLGLVRMVLKHRRGPNRAAIAGLEDRFSQVERRLVNLETIATSKDEELRKAFDTLTRDG